MADHGTGPSGPGLDGLWDRIPKARTVVVERGGGLTALRVGWRRRHSVAMLLLTPPIFFAYWSATGAGLEASRLLVIGAMALTGALLLTTYLPQRGAKAALDSSCALMPALFVPLAGILLSLDAMLTSGLAALAFLGLGLWQRIAASSVCRS